MANEQQKEKKGMDLFDKIVEVGTLGGHSRNIEKRRKEEAKLRESAARSRQAEAGANEADQRARALELKTQRQQVAFLTRNARQDADRGYHEARDTGSYEAYNFATTVDEDTQGFYRNKGYEPGSARGINWGSEAERRRFANATQIPMELINDEEGQKLLSRFYMVYRDVDGPNEKGKEQFGEWDKWLGMMGGVEERTRKQLEQDAAAIQDRLDAIHAEQGTEPGNAGWREPRKEVLTKSIARLENIAEQTPEGDPSLPGLSLANRLLKEELDLIEGTTPTAPVKTQTEQEKDEVALEKERLALEKAENDAATSAVTRRVAEATEGDKITAAAQQVMINDSTVLLNTAKVAESQRGLAADLAANIAHLKQQHRQGVITREEYIKQANPLIDQLTNMERTEQDISEGAAAVIKKNLRRQAGLPEEEGATNEPEPVAKPAKPTPATETQSDNGEKDTTVAVVDDSVKERPGAPEIKVQQDSGKGADPNPVIKKPLGDFSVASYSQSQKPSFSKKGTPQKGGPSAEDYVKQYDFKPETAAAVVGALKSDKANRQLTIEANPTPADLNSALKENSDNLIGYLETILEDPTIPAVQKQELVEHIVAQIDNDTEERIRRGEANFEEVGSVEAKKHMALLFSSAGNIQVGFAGGGIDPETGEFNPKIVLDNYKQLENIFGPIDKWKRWLNDKTNQRFFSGVLGDGSGAYTISNFMIARSAFSRFFAGAALTEPEIRRIVDFDIDAYTGDPTRLVNDILAMTEFMQNYISSNIQGATNPRTRAGYRILNQQIKEAQISGITAQLVGHRLASINDEWAWVPGLEESSEARLGELAALREQLPYKYGKYIAERVESNYKKVDSLITEEQIPINEERTRKLIEEGGGTVPRDIPQVVKQPE